MPAHLDLIIVQVRKTQFSCQTLWSLWSLAGVKMRPNRPFKLQLDSSEWHECAQWAFHGILRRVVKTGAIWFRAEKVMMLLRARLTDAV